jgi:hypothetical protein
MGGDIQTIKGSSDDTFGSENEMGYGVTGELGLRNLLSCGFGRGYAVCYATTPTLAPPILRFTFNRWRFRILDLHPMRNSTGAVRRTEPLRHDALAAERAGVLEDGCAVTVIVDVEDDSLTLRVQDFGQYMLALLDWTAAQVLAINLDSDRRRKEWRPGRGARSGAGQRLRGRARRPRWPRRRSSRSAP